MPWLKKLFRKMRCREEAENPQNTTAAESQEGATSDETPPPSKSPNPLAKERKPESSWESPSRRCGRAADYLVRWIVPLIIALPTETQQAIITWFQML